MTITLIWDQAWGGSLQIRILILILHTIAHNIYFILCVLVCCLLFFYCLVFFCLSYCVQWWLICNQFLMDNVSYPNAPCGDIVNRRNVCIVIKMMNFPVHFSRSINRMNIISRFLSQRWYLANGCSNIARSNVFGDMARTMDHRRRASAKTTSC
jgi:hypothetical protein